MTIINYRETQSRRRWVGQRALLSAAVLLCSSSAFALSCGFPTAPGVLNNPDSPPNIAVGVITEVRLEKPATAQQGPMVGQLKIIETLRGKPRDSIRVITSGFDGPWKGVLRMGLPYLVMFKDGEDKELVFGPCQKPLRLNPHNVSIGHDCILYQFRTMLNIPQTRSRVCEVVNRRMSQPQHQIRNQSRQQAKRTREILQEEIRRAKWEDLGVDWGQ